MTARASSARRRRSATRGAVLVEAILVAAVLILFFLAFLYVHGAFTLQLRVQEASRAAALAYAMNACEGGTPSGLASEDSKLVNAPATAPGSSDTVADAQTGKLTEPAAASAFEKATATNTGFGLPPAAAVSARGTASATDGKETLSGTVLSRTTLLCNEKPREGTLDGAVDTVVDFMKF